MYFFFDFLEYQITWSNSSFYRNRDRDSRSLGVLESEMFNVISYGISDGREKPD